MTEYEFRKMFPKASVSFASANPNLLTAVAAATQVVSRPKPRRGKMNNTELEYAFILERMKRNDEISDWKYEGITLRWNGVRYTADFAVFPSELDVSGRIKLIEVKGPFIAGNRARAVERFRHAKTYWTYFDFELHQRTKDGWHRLI